MQRQLISPAESFLHNWGLLILWAAVGVRLLLPLFFSSGMLLKPSALLHNSWMLPSQWIGVGLLTAALNLAGSLIGGGTGRGASYVLGTLAYAAALSLMPQYLWPQMENPPLVLVYGALVLAALSFGLRLLRQQRWAAELQGHGWQWMLDWAEGRPLYARVLALKTVRALGWKSGK
jgi:hypothetical protein